MIEKQRKLCAVVNCNNLAVSKGIKNGRRVYHRFCDKHRRLGHYSKALRNPNSIHYLPLDKCIMCNSAAVDRHRIIPKSKYETGAALALCRRCHQGIHKFYDELEKLGYTIVR